jgi:hypothetical protein
LADLFHAFHCSFFRRGRGTLEALLLDAAGGVHQASDGLMASIFKLQVEMKDSAKRLLLHSVT